MTRKEELIQKLFEGKCSPKELELLFQLLEKHEKKEIPVLKELWRQYKGESRIDTLDSSRIFEKVIGQIQLHTEESSIGDIKRKSNIRLLWLKRVALAASFLFISGLILWVWTSGPDEISIHAAYGERIDFELPDGSTVVLNSNSELTYFPDWDSDYTRRVVLEGEAFFRVKKIPESNVKFVVSTNDLELEVLGTIFNVHARGDRTQVYLEEGSIKLNLPEGKIKERYMEPGEIISYSVKEKKITSQEVADSSVTSWKSGVLTLEEAPMKEVFEHLTDLYGVQFEFIDSSILQGKAEVNVPMGNIDLALSVLGQVMKFEFTKKEEKYLISSIQ